MLDFINSVSELLYRVNSLEIAGRKIRRLPWREVAVKFRPSQRNFMSQTGRQSLNTSKVLCVIMGGGQGTRLFPLTKDRAKPAVPLAGKYRLVDIPISNCINSGFRRIYVLTQFNSTSLHGHISRTYKFDQFTSGFVEILAAQQTLTNTSWYEGTADAVRKNLMHFLNHDFDYLLILSGDQLYRMDFRADDCRAHRNRRGHHRRHDSGGARRSAIVWHHADRRGPAHHALRGKAQGPGVAGLVASAARLAEKNGNRRPVAKNFSPRWAFTFSTATSICELLDNPLSDFGKHIIPHAINIAPRFLPRFSRLLGGHRNDPLLFRGESGFGFRTAALQFLRHERADFFASAFSARLKNQRRADRTRRHFRRLHHQPCAHQKYHRRPAHIRRRRARN